MTEKKIIGNLTYFLESNVDTDIIIPARFLKRTSLDGFIPFSFYERKYLPSTICEPKFAKKDFVFEKTGLNPDFPPNHPNSLDATFLLTWFNFGCGSSREHAVYSLSNFRVIIGSAPKDQAPFADIFRDNCRQNLIWTPVLTESDHTSLSEKIKKELPNKKVGICLNIFDRTIETSDGDFKADFDIPDSHFEFISKSDMSPQELAQSEINKHIQKIDNWLETQGTSTPSLLA